jgi:membrane protein YqaA with SNARE-associated domain
MARSRRTKAGQNPGVATPEANATVRKKRPVTKKKPGTKRTSRLTLRHKIAAMVWVSIIISVLMVVFGESIAQLGSWGYLGAFIINGVSSATVVLPAPGGAIVLLMAGDYHWLPLGIAAGLGGTLGSLTAYLVGTQTRPAFQKRRFYEWTSRATHRYGYIILFLLTLPPVSPGDFGGILAGATKYPIRKFLLAVGFASVIKMVVMAYLATWSLAWLEKIIPSWGQSFSG